MGIHELWLKNQQQDNKLYCLRAKQKLNLLCFNTNGLSLRDKL